MKQKLNETKQNKVTKQNNMKQNTKQNMKPNNTKQSNTQNVDQFLNIICQINLCQQKTPTKLAFTIRSEYE